MLRAGYDPKLASGVICASGTLGQIIPPSTVLIFMGDMLGGMNAQVQMEKGNFAPEVVSVGNLFAGAFLPGTDDGRGSTWPGWSGRPWSDPESCPALEVTAAERREPRARRARLDDPDAGADRRGARLDPRGRRHAHRERVGRRGGRDAARGGAPPVLAGQPQGGRWRRRRPRPR